MSDAPFHTNNYRAFRLKVRGRVQGVGFRPFVFRLAHDCHLAGEVCNQPDGVSIFIEGTETDCQKFIRSLREEAPGAAVIKEIVLQESPPENHRVFSIRPSRESDQLIAEVCPDISICDDCLEELNADTRRSGYPFINCTNCGPRFTIIEDFPYDRKHTSMNEFSMCKTCRKEFENPLDRRFHAQPTSCPDCGPAYVFHENGQTETDFSTIIRKLGDQLDEGRVVALKGLGGYHIACGAFNEAAVAELRSFKKRERKPLAVMFRSVDALRKIMPVSIREEQILTSWRKPIVVLSGQPKSTLASGITAGLKSLGAFLPYLPLHHLLFEKLSTDAIVLTSGNESDTPILHDDREALHLFKELSGGTLTNNRRIARRADDSVVRVILNSALLMRRSRGYCPAPVDLNFSVDGILATGAELSNAFCIGSGNQAVFSQHIGDLKNVETYDFFTENIAKFSEIYRFKPRRYACDMHPDYLSTKYALDSGKPCIGIQHHHAHIAAVMAEHGLEEPVIGVAYDGTGYGTDGHTWGSEVMLADYKNFQRISHFEYIPLPGGDRVTDEPWRTALSYLVHSYVGEWDELDIPLLQKLDISRAKKLEEAVRKGINSPLSCSAGRLFDAIAALTGICTESNYHAEAPQLLENYLHDGPVLPYSFLPGKTVSFSPMIREIILDLQRHLPLESIITRFHTTIAEAARLQVKLAAEKQDINKVALSGGSFQNKYLTEKLVHLLKQDGFTVFLPGEVSCNDGGIALGQLAIAAHKMK
ncbi:MAG: carbamoyltransferase HypF [Bacteroidales bacterium]|nr:carbamoyltransferase HypF [Bacteroidales bacterium]